MQLANDSVVLSPSDLMRFQGCTHATGLDLRYLRGEEGLQPDTDTEEARHLQKRGDAHEAAFLEKLRADGAQVTVINTTVSFEQTAAETEAALRRGDAYVYQ